MPEFFEDFTEGDIVFRTENYDYEYMVVKKGTYTQASKSSLRMVCHDNNCSIFQTNIGDHPIFRPFMDKYHVKWIFMANNSARISDSDDLKASGLTGSYTKPRLHEDHVLVFANEEFYLVVVKKYMKSFESQL